MANRVYHRVDLVEKDEQEGVIALGTIAVIKSLTLDKVVKLLGDSWLAFQETHPDTDSEFVNYLVNRYPDTFEEAEGNHTFVVNWSS